MNRVKFQTQFDAIFGTRDRQNVACARACKKMMSDAGFLETNSSDRIDMLVWNKTNQLTKAKTFLDAQLLLDDCLAKGYPVMVGVNRQNSSVGNANKATSHFVVIVGKTAAGYRFFDPGTSHESKGTHATNLLKADANGWLRGISFYNKREYIVTEVRPSIKK